MTTSLEVPVPPGWPRTPEARIDPPHVAVDFRWEYKEVVRVVPEGIISEAELNALGAERWELVGIVPTGTRVHFYFKREQGV
ncbi:MAG TPA: hypothetical protein VH680_14125 [Gemmatimonadales bacterium]|jgi:hypothetical protein